ncbi:MAG TPA: hypothetical protein DGG95_13915, partial [Cytophagales bacterium]|nr:hypothetical protein [Cytophagales bacterium]
NSEAFEFLNQTSETTNPVDVMNLALLQLERLQEKPFFIDRVFLEVLVQTLTVATVVAKAQEQPKPAEESLNRES